MTSPKIEAARKTCCTECGWKGTQDQMVDVSVFDEAVAVCPKCHYVESSVRFACDEDGCWEYVTCGTPTNNGYRSTCGRH